MRVMKPALSGPLPLDIARPDFFRACLMSEEPKTRDYYKSVSVFSRYAFPGMYSSTGRPPTFAIAAPD